MFFKNNNLAARVFERQILTPRPSTSANLVRKFYENLVPSYTLVDINCPDHSFRKITDDGHFLISFSKNNQELIIYRPKWPSFSCKHFDCDIHEVPSNARKFDSFFSQICCISLASANELICKEFFLYVESYCFGLFATSTAQLHDTPATDGAVPRVPSIEKITFHLVRLEDGIILDERVFCNDFIYLSHTRDNTGVFLYDDLLAIVSLRYQTIHILQIRGSGNLVDVRKIGSFCQEDDELFLNSHSEYMAGQELNVEQMENGVHDQEVIERGPFLSGIKQRLLSFIFRVIWNEETDHTLKVHSLNKKFYRNFQYYANLMMLKVLFLDRCHLLIKLGWVDGVVSRNCVSTHPTFFAVYNMETTEIVSFYQNSSDELYTPFEKFCDHFHAASRNSLHVNFISSHSNNIHALEQLKEIKSKATSYAQFVQKITGSLPFSCQSQSPSPYFDLSLFRYDEKLISALDRQRQCFDHPIKFTSRRSPHPLKFKINPGTDSSNADCRSRRACSFLFHPYLPLVISIQQTYVPTQPPIVNIHFRR